MFLCFRLIASWMAFEANLAPFGDGFGSQVGTKLAPHRSKNQSKKQSKNYSHFVSIFGRLLLDFGPNLDPKSREQRFVMLVYVGSWGPLGPKTGPRANKNVEKWFLGPPLGSQVEAQNRSKSVPRAIQNVVIFWIDSETHFWSNLEPTWAQLGSQNRPKMEPSWLQKASKRQ